MINSDFILPFYIDNASVRGRFVRINDQIQNILNRHQYPSIINRYVCEMVVIASAMAVDTKHSGTFTLQITNGSIVKFIVVDISQDGYFRACAKWNHEDLNSLLNEKKSPSLGDLFGAATMAFSTDLSHENKRYQAIIELRGSTLCESIHYYFSQSEQLPTALIVYTSQDSSSYCSAGALLIQRMASSSSSSYEGIESGNDDEWFESVCLLSTLKKEELLNCDLKGEEVLFRLFHEHNLQIQSPILLKERCKCSKDRVKEVLNQFSQEDRHEMLVNNTIALTCEFCSRAYYFDIDGNNC